VVSRFFCRSRTGHMPDSLDLRRQRFFAQGYVPTWCRMVPWPAAAMSGPGAASTRGTSPPTSTGRARSDARIVRWYSRRADSAENRIGISAATSAGRVCPAAGSAPVRRSWPRVPSPAACSSGPRSLRIRPGPAGSGHGSARPEMRPATAFRHGNRHR